MSQDRPDARQVRELRAFADRFQRGIVRVNAVDKGETPETRLMRVEVPEGRCGAWAVERFTVTEANEALGRLRAACNEHERFVSAGTYTRLVFGGTEVVMSDTPDEKRDHIAPVREAMRRARDAEIDVLITGLGLGLVTTAMLAIPNVRSVTVVECASGVIRLVGRPLEKRHLGRLRIYESDAFTWRPPPGARYAIGWHDIWSTISVENLPDMHRLHRKFGKRCVWQGSWARALCERRRKEERAWRGRATTK